MGKLEPREDDAIYSDLADDREMTDLIDRFVTSLRDRARSLRATLAAGDLESLRRLAHRLRGAAAGYGFPSISAAGAALEDELRAGAPSERVAVATDTVAALCERARPGSQAALIGADAS